jgi:hypothetical protein
LSHRTDSIDEAAGISARWGWDAVFHTLGGMAIIGAAALATQWRRT